jgi:hypothetical protein
VQFDFIDDAGTGAGKYGYLTRIRYIGDDLYACGDLMQIYRRVPGGAWQTFDFGTRISDQRAVGVSLNDLDGRIGHDIYAVGDRGVILRFAGDRWEKRDSSTGANLERVLVDDSGVVWACGSERTVLRGRNNAWEVVTRSEQPDETLWGLAKFGGNVYVCSSTALYRLEDGGLRPVIVSGFIGAPFRLAANHRFLWLLGFDDLMRFDGNTWQRVDWRS